MKKLILLVILLSSQVSWSMSAALTPENRALFSAKTAAEAQIALAAGADINAEDEDGGTALHIGTISGNKEVTQLLLDRGANVNAKDTDGRTALHYAGNNQEIAQLLLGRGADIDARDNYGRTTLHYARHNQEVIQLLLDRGADINARDNDGSTVLDMAKKRSARATVSSTFKTKLDQIIRLLEIADPELDTDEKS